MSNEPQPPKFAIGDRLRWRYLMRGPGQSGTVVEVLEVKGTTVYVMATPKGLRQVAEVLVRADHQRITPMEHR